MPLTMELERSTGGGTRLSVRIEGIGDEDNEELGFVRNIFAVHALLVHPETGPIDTFDVQTVAYAGMLSKEGPDSLIITGTLHWENTEAVEYDGLGVEVQITTVDKQTYGVWREFALPTESDEQKSFPGVVFTPSVEDLTDSSAVFVALAERKRNINGEHFPSSEFLRVEIVDRDGAILWSSAKGKLFSNSYNLVFPMQKGQFERYELTWNGRTNDGAPLAPGQYKAYLSLIAKPIPYTDSLTFIWNSAND